MRFSLKVKIVGALVILIVLLIGITVGISIRSFNRYSVSRAEEAMKETLGSFHVDLYNRKESVGDLAYIFARGQDLSEGMVFGNIKAVADYLHPLTGEGGFNVTVVDRSRVAVFKPHDLGRQGEEVEENDYLMEAWSRGGLVGYALENGLPVVQAIKPILRDGIFAGHLLISAAMDDTFMEEKRGVLGEGSSVYLFVNGELAAKALTEGESEVEAFALPADLYERLRAAGEPEVILEARHIVGYLPLKDTFGEVISVAVVRRCREAALLAAANMRNNLLGVGAVILLISVAVGVKASGVVIKPVYALNSVMQAFGSGDLTARIGDKLLYDDEIGDVGRTLNRELENQRQSMLAIKENADQLAGASQQIAASSQQIAAGNQQQANEVQSIVAMVGENAQAIEEVAKVAETAAGTAEKAVEIAGKGNKAAEDAISSMRDIQSKVEELGMSSRRIGEIVKVINDIADQTALLSLNAAIEAARAGEHGRGFAVVADEVRKLAERSGSATKDIEKLVEQIRGDTEETVAGVNEGAAVVQKAGDALAEIMESNKEVMSRIRSIFDSTAVMTGVGEKVAGAVESISAVVEETAAGAEETAAGAEELSAMADRLSGLTERFKLVEGSDQKEEVSAEGTGADSKAVSGESEGKTVGV